jgi:hypothetical protein
LKEDFRDEARDVFMNKGDMVEIVDIDKQDKWLVRNKKNLNQVCLIPFKVSAREERSVRGKDAVTGA